MLGQLELCDRVSALIDDVTVTPDGLTAETAGETYEADSPHALALRLGPVLYQTMHAGFAKPFDAAVRSWRDRPFDALLSAATGPRTTSVSGRPIRAEEGHTIVELDGVRVRVPNDAIAQRSDDAARVLVPSARPGLSPGFFLTTASIGHALGGGPTLRLYARLDDPDAAPALWREVGAFLEAAAVPYRAKISSSRLLYPRNDALVIYLPRPAWRIARSCGEMLQATGLLGEGTSPFTHAITSSVGCAFEPDDTRVSKKDMSFGQHRTQVFAEALVKYATLPGGAHEPVDEVVAAAFLDAGIDPSEPARNLASPAVNVLRTF
jgi:hypothetical protein